MVRSGSDLTISASMRIASSSSIPSASAITSRFALNLGYVLIKSALGRRTFAPVLIYLDIAKLQPMLYGLSMVISEK